MIDQFRAAFREFESEEETRKNYAIVYDRKP